MRLLRLLADQEQATELAEQKAELETQMIALHAELDKYYTPAWELFEAMLLDEQRKAFVDIMNADEQTILMARERAKLLQKFLNRKGDLERDLDRLRTERNALEE